MVLLVFLPYRNRGVVPNSKRETLDFKNDQSGSLNVATIGSSLVGFSLPHIRIMIDALAINTTV